MLIDTIMALWNRILGRKLKKVVITSILLGGLVSLLVIIGISSFAHPAKVTKHVIQSIDVANKKEHAISSQLYLDGLSAPPSPPVESVISTPTAVQPLPTPTVSDQQSQTDQAPAASPPSPSVPTSVVPTHVPVATFHHSTVKHHTAPGTKHVKLNTSQTPSPTRVSPKAATVSTAVPEAPPTPTSITPEESNSPTPETSPLPTVTGTVPVDPNRAPEIIVTPTSTNGSSYPYENWASAQF
jgi:outer membrane biosynthesis protein TonB